MGLDVLQAATVGGALRQLEAHAPDIVLTDVHLPDGSGLALLEALRQRLPGSDALVITGLPDVSLAARAMKDGAFDFLTKPLAVEELDAVLTRCLRDREVRRGTPLTKAPVPAPPLDHIVGRSAGMVEVFKRVGLAASNRSPVLIRGETGTGKEVIARAIHRFACPQEPFVAVNCAAVADTLLQSDLFGHAKGAFTGAHGARRGRFELARRGTLFLDEIGDTSPSFQGGILRAVQEGEVLPLGVERPVRVEARLVTATHRPLEALLDQGRFRADLYYRLRVIEIVLPPLRERKEDLPVLVDHFLGRAASLLNRRIAGVGPGVLGWVESRAWPGNVRELENAVTRAVAMSRGSVLTVDDLEGAAAPAPLPGMEAPSMPSSEVGALTLDQVIQKHVEDVLASAGGNKREACRRLGISPARLYRLLDQSGTPPQG